MNFNERNNRPAQRRQPIEFDDRTDSTMSHRSRMRGLRDEDWAHDEMTLNRPRQREEMPPKKQSFIRRHPIIMNLLYVILACIAFGWIAMWFLDYWTFHGQERVVPDARNISVVEAMNNVRSSGLKAVITDSVFDSYARPGTVVEQTPIPGARIKQGGTVYLTIVSYTPKMVTVPDFYNVSQRQAKSMFEGLGLPPVIIETVPSEYEGLVLGARYNGVTLSPGARIPMSARVTLQVGSGYEELEDLGAPIDSLAIDEVIDKLDID